MKHQWRLLLFRSTHRLFLTHHSQFQVIPNSIRSLSSFLHQRSEIRDLQQSQFLLSLEFPFSRSFSSEPAIEEKPSPEAIAINVFTRLNDKNEIKKELNSNDIVISHELGLKVLRSLESNPNLAKRFFDWVSETSSKKLSSKSYNTMLRILGVNGLNDDFWRLVDVMKKNGHGVSANVRDKVSEKFRKDGLETDLNKLQELFASGSIDNSVDKVCNRVCKIVMKENQWSNEVEKQLRELKIDFDSDLVKMIVEKLDLDPRKALLFFRWINESNSFKHDEKTYNAMARVLGKEKYLDRFQNIIEEIRSLGYEMEMETYVRVSARFCQSRMIKEAVELFEFAMSGDSNSTPTAHCCSLLLKKIVAGKKLDMDLFSRTVKAYTGNNGGVITDTMLQHVLKSLRSVDRFGESNEVLKAMKESGYVPNGELQSVIASGLSRKGKKDEANELVNFMEASGDHKAMTSLIEKHCDGKNLDEALTCFKKMINKGEGGVAYADYVFEKLVLAYCNGFRAREVYKVFIEVVEQNKLKPWHSSYKIMIRNLLMKKVAREGGFEEALSLLPLMRSQGFPPFVDPFLDYLSNSGTSSEAFEFLKAVSSKKFPSNSMVLRVFEAMLKASRHSEAQDLLSLCPSYIRRNSDVLELFRSMKPEKPLLEAPPQIEA